MHWAYPLLPSHHLLSPRLCHSLPTGTVLTHEHPLAPVYSRSAGTRVMKRMLSFALSFPRRELQQIISICHQINRFQNEHFPHSPEGNRSIHLSVRQAGLHIQTCIWTKANLNNTYIFCVTPKQPKPPFPQGEGPANFGPFKLPASGFHHLSSYSLDANWKWLTCIAGLAYGAFDSQPRKRGCVPGEMPQTEMMLMRGCWLISQAEHPGAQPTSHGSSRTHEESSSSYASGPEKQN